MRCVSLGIVCLLMFSSWDVRAGGVVDVEKFIASLKEADPAPKFTVDHIVQTTGSCDFLEFSSDGKRLAGVFDGNQLVVWEAVDKIEPMNSFMLVRHVPSPRPPSDPHPQ